MNKNINKAELMKYISNMQQLAGINSITYDNGLARGCRCYQVYTGSGLRFDIQIDRCLDILNFEYKGYNLSWTSPVGLVHPAFYSAKGLDWLNSFQGGLLATCGLDHFGAPCEDNNEQFGIHGRIGNTPAYNTRCRSFWDNEQYKLEIYGEVKQARVHGENLLLQRKITTSLYSKKITIVDTVTNESFLEQPHMILYHCNFGYPLVSENSKLRIQSKNTVPIDTNARANIKDWMNFTTPIKSTNEQVFIHHNSDGKAVISNPAINLELHINYDTNTLPHLFQWKMVNQGNYVLGIEPANCGTIKGRKDARTSNKLPFLKPKESMQYTLNFEIKEL